MNFIKGLCKHLEVFIREIVLTCVASYGQQCEMTLLGYGVKRIEKSKNFHGK